MSQSRTFRDTLLPKSLNDPPQQESSSIPPIPEALDLIDIKPAKTSRTVATYKDHQLLSKDKKRPVLDRSKAADFGIVKLLVDRRETKGTDTLMIGDQRYDKIQLINQAGPGLLSMEDSDTFPLVVIRESKYVQKGYTPIHPASHANIIRLRAVFHHAESISTVYDYEMGAMTLSSVSSCPSVKFSDADIATVCRAVLSGLDFIHSELKIAHGMIDDGNILLTLAGDIKLGYSMLKNITLRDRDCDVKGVGTIAMNLADRTTKIERPDITHWKASVSKNLREFILGTSELVLRKLLKHEFLELAAPGWSLKPHLTKSMKFDPSFRQIASVG